MAGKRKVLVVQRRMTHYRVPFFEELRKELGRRNLDLQVAYGVGTDFEAKKKDSGELAWGTRLTTRYFAGGRLCWQPFGRQMNDAALTIVTSENKLLYNLIAQYVWRGRCIGLWGHGANLQGDQRGLLEAFKRIVARRASWWFAYTRLSVPLILRSGFPPDRVTVLDNAVDTGALSRQVQAVTDSRLNTLKEALGLEGRAVGIFIGSLYYDKRIAFMLEAALRIRDSVPAFEFLIAGAGPDAGLVETFCRSHPWARYLGPIKGEKKAEAIAVSTIMLNPGLVGLGILDSFACAVPMLTTDCGLHSPEIAYLQNDENGLMTENSVEAFASASISLLQDERRLDRLRLGCRASAAKYTLGNMARNFADGVERCLALQDGG